MKRYSSFDATLLFIIALTWMGCVEGTTDANDKDEKTIVYNYNITNNVTNNNDDDGERKNSPQTRRKGGSKGPPSISNNEDNSAQQRAEIERQQLEADRQARQAELDRQNLPKKAICNTAEKVCGLWGGICKVGCDYVLEPDQQIGYRGASRPIKRKNE